MPVVAPPSPAPPVVVDVVPVPDGVVAVDEVLELDLEAGEALYRRTDYDIAGAAAAIRAARLPDSLAERLAYGQ